MSRFEVSITHDLEHQFERWTVEVDAPDEVAALIKVLRRRAFAAGLLEHGRARFKVEAVR